MRKVLGIVLVLALLLTGIAVAEETGLRNDVMILFTGDIHCGIDKGYGYAGVAAIRDAYEAAGYTVILADVGDAVQGEAVGILTKGKAIIELMNVVGYDVATLGNHEFGCGMEELFARIEEAEYPYVSANFNKNGELLLPGYVLLEAAGVKIGFVGVTTPATITSSMPEYFMDEDGNYIYGFFEDDTQTLIWEKVQESVDAARAEGADYVVALAHLGNEGSYNYENLIANTSGIDIVFDGHSHDTGYAAVCNKEGEPVGRQASGTKGEGIGYAKIAKDGTITMGLHHWEFEEFSAMEAYGIENEAAQKVKEIQAALAEQLNTVCAKSEVDLYIYDPYQRNEDGSKVRIVRKVETNFGDLCADAFRSYANADIGVLNGSAIRTDMAMGDMTHGDIMTAVPFETGLSCCYATGQEILDMLEFSVRNAPNEDGGFLQVSGLTFTYDPTIATTVETDVNGMFIGVSGERRVQEVLVGGEPLDLDRTYLLAGNNYILGDSGYSMFADNEYIISISIHDYEVLETYIQEVLGGVIGEEYADPYGQGRIIAK